MHKYPLLTKETLDKEVHNIHSEFMISYNSEIRRVNEILCENMDDKHPFNVFGAGNLTTLSGNWSVGAISSTVQKGRNLGLARSVQLEFIGPASQKWGVNSIGYKYQSRRVKG